LIAISVSNIHDPFDVFVFERKEHARSESENQPEAPIMSGRLVICAFKPKSGLQDELLSVVEKHWRILKAEQLVTDRPRSAMQAADGTIVEVFEWKSAEAIEKAHHNPVVLALWKEFEAACEYIPLASLPESLHPFSEFTPLDM
jgi:hypothetical protein